jgi:hypothetical protein
MRLLAKRTAWELRALHVFLADGRAYCLDVGVSDISVGAVLDAAREKLMSMSRLDRLPAADDDLWRRFAKAKFVEQFSFHLGPGRRPVQVAVSKEVVDGSSD